MLTLVTDPNRIQHADIKKLNINVAKLEEATWDTLSGFFADVSQPNNLKKKPFLKEIFRVAKYQERYKNGEIGGSPLLQNESHTTNADVNRC